MKITDISIRLCSMESTPALAAAKLPGGQVPDALVVTLTTDEGVTGTSWGFAGFDAVRAGHTVSAVKDYFVGRDPLAREKNLREFRDYDRRWNHVPIYAYGPFDLACWDIVGQVAGLPVHDVIGRAHDALPTYASSMFLTGGPEAYAEQALAVKEAGLHGYKVHVPGPVQVDLEVHRAVREAVGPDFNLMSDPVATYTYPEALRVGRQLEELGYLWLEEPVYDYDFASLRKLSRDLDIPIAATETPAGAHFITAEFIATDCVDIVRTDPSWRGGITSSLKIAALAESFGMQCEVHTAIAHPMEFGNAHVALAIPNTTFFEILWPTDDFEHGLVSGLPIEDGYLQAMTDPGLAVDYDWDWIEKTTIGTL